MSEKYDAPEDEWPRKGESGNSTNYGYSVEARYASGTPAMIAGQIFDLRWRRVQYNEGHIGVPAPQRFGSSPAEYRLFGKAQAEALRWWFVAEAQNGGTYGYCVETRIVKHKITETFSVEAISADTPKDYRSE